MALERIAVRTLALALLWLVLVDGELDHLALAGLALAGAVIAGGPTTTPPVRIDPLGLLRFIPFFVRASISGGLDVAARAFRRRALDPELIRHPLRLPEHAPARTFLAAVVNLIPGTLCVDLDADGLGLHVIDRGQDPRETLATLEDRVAALFGQPLAPTQEGS